jgi:hypothetical protein
MRVDGKTNKADAAEWWEMRPFSWMVEKHALELQQT